MLLSSLSMPTLTANPLEVSADWFVDTVRSVVGVDADGRLLGNVLHPFLDMGNVGKHQDDVATITGLDCIS